MNKKSLFCPIFNFYTIILLISIIKVNTFPLLLQKLETVSEGDLEITTNWYGSDTNYLGIYQNDPEEESSATDENNEGVTTDKPDFEVHGSWTTVIVIGLIFVTVAAFIAIPFYVIYKSKKFSDLAKTKSLEVQTEKEEDGKNVNVNSNGVLGVPGIGEEEEGKEASEDIESGIGMDEKQNEIEETKF